MTWEADNKWVLICFVSSQLVGETQGDIPSRKGLLQIGQESDFLRDFLGTRSSSVNRPILADNILHPNSGPPPGSLL